MKNSYPAILSLLLLLLFLLLLLLLPPAPTSSCSSCSSCCSLLLLLLNLDQKTVLQHPSRRWVFFLVDLLARLWEGDSTNVAKLHVAEESFHEYLLFDQKTVLQKPSGLESANPAISWSWRILIKNLFYRQNGLIVGKGQSLYGQYFEQQNHFHENLLFDQETVAQKFLWVGEGSSMKIWEALCLGGGFLKVLA